MLIVFGALPFFPILASLAVLFIAALLGLFVNGSLKRGVYNGRYMVPLVIANVFLLTLNQFYECAAGGKCWLGLPSQGILTGGMATVGLVASIALILALPVSALILSAHAFGWLYWLLGGKRRIKPPSSPNNKAINAFVDGPSKPSPKRFGIRDPE